VLVGHLLEQSPSDEPAQQGLAVVTAQLLELAARGGPEGADEADDGDLLVTDRPELLGGRDRGHGPLGEPQGSELDADAVVGGGEADGGEAGADGEEPLADGRDAGPGRSSEIGEKDAAADDHARGEPRHHRLIQTKRGAAREEDRQGCHEAEPAAELLVGAHRGDASPCLDLADHRP
jgi:hypothetical protein